MRRDVPGQSGTGRTAVPAQKKFLVPPSLCPGTKTNSLSWDKRRDKSSSKNPGTNSYVLEQKMSKKPKIFLKNSIFFFNFFTLFSLLYRGCPGIVRDGLSKSRPGPYRGKISKPCPLPGFDWLYRQQRISKNRFQKQIKKNQISDNNKY